MAVPIKIFNLSYAKPKPTEIFMASLNDEIVGSLIFYKVNYFPSLKAYEVSIARVKKEFRRMGIAKALLNYAIKLKKPDIICGFTNNPNGVLYRYKSCKKNSMKSFFGYFDLDKKKFDSGNVLYNKILAKYFKVKKNKLRTLPYFYIPSPRLSSRIPNMSEYPVYLQAAFSDLISVQSKTKTGKTAVFPLINIRRSLFLKS